MSDYEYACAKFEKDSGELIERHMVWEDLASAKSEVKLMSGYSSTYFNYALVKRRKAGPVERVKND